MLEAIQRILALVPFDEADQAPILLIEQRIDEVLVEDERQLAQADLRFLDDVQLGLDLDVLQQVDDEVVAVELQLRGHHRPLLDELSDDADQDDLHLSLLVLELQQPRDRFQEEVLQFVAVLLGSLVDHCGRTGPVAFPLLLVQVEVDDVLQDLLEDDLHLPARQFGHDVCQVLDGLGLHRVVLGLDLLHVGLSDEGGGLFIGVEVDVSGEDELAEPFGGHFHVVRVVVAHLVDEDVELLLAHFRHVPLLLLYLQQEPARIYQLDDNGRLL